MDKTIIIFEERMAGWLMYNGFHKLTEKKDLKNKDKTIFIFENNSKIKKIMEKYERLVSDYTLEHSYMQLHKTIIY